MLCLGKCVFSIIMLFLIMTLWFLKCLFLGAISFLEMSLCYKMCFIKCVCVELCWMNKRFLTDVFFVVVTICDFLNSLVLCNFMFKFMFFSLLKCSLLWGLFWFSELLLCFENVIIDIWLYHYRYFFWSAAVFRGLFVELMFHEVSFLLR